MISLVKIRRVSSVSLPLSASFPLSAVRLDDVIFVVILQESRFVYYYADVVGPRFLPL